jgi:hypothetical protein
VRAGHQAYPALFVWWETSSPTKNMTPLITCFLLLFHHGYNQFSHSNRTIRTALAALLLQSDISYQLPIITADLQYYNG